MPPVAETGLSGMTVAAAEQYLAAVPAPRWEPSDRLCATLLVPRPLSSASGGHEIAGLAEHRPATRYSAIASGGGARAAVRPPSLPSSARRSTGPRRPWFFLPGHWPLTTGR